MRTVFTFLLGLQFFLSGCSGIIQPGAIYASETPHPVSKSTPLQPTKANLIPSEEPIDNSPETLILWVPDDFAINSGEQVQKLLIDRLDAFEINNPGISIDLRFKNVKQKESMMDLLNTANRVAPSVLPDLILLNRNDMETAAIKGLLVPFDHFPTNAENYGLYPGIEDPGKLQGSTFGIPAAGDGLFLIDKKIGGEQLPAWSDILSSSIKIGLNLNDPNGTVFIALYLSGGGELTDDNGKPHLDPVIFTKLLAFIRQTRIQSAFPDWALLASDWTEVSKRFENGESDMEINWYSSTRKNGLNQYRYHGLPGLSDSSATILSGWYWSIANSAPDRPSIRMELLSFLSQPVFASPWSNIAGYLPVSNQEWPIFGPSSTEMQSVLDSAKPLPDTSILITVGPVIRDAAIRAYTSSDSIDEIAASAIAHINQDK
jgi:ABC-type glycerol-3-phosphate transport system substrate-binding protein